MTTDVISCAWQSLATNEVITKCDESYHKVRQELQSATDLLQSATVQQLFHIDLLNWHGIFC